MSQLDEFNQNNLLFKRFQGVAQTNIVEPNSYQQEPRKALVNTYNESIFSDNVPKDICGNYSCQNLDDGPDAANPNVPDVSNTLSDSYSTGVFGEIPIIDALDASTNLTFYKKVFLNSASGTPNAWWLIDPSNAPYSTDNNKLKDMIPFLYNDIDTTLFTPIVYYYTGSNTTNPSEAEINDDSNWTPKAQQQSPLYWLMDYASGILQLYAETDSNGYISGTSIKTQFSYPPNAWEVPRISFIKYTGSKGAAGGGGGGGGGDVSGGFTEASFNELFTKKPDFMVDCSGAFDIADQRIELNWVLPQQTRAAYHPAPFQDSIPNVFTPSLPAPHAPYYPGGYGGNRLSTQVTEPTTQYDLDLVVPAYSTGTYSSQSNDPSFNDLNWLPYHQYVGVDIRRRSSGAVSEWCPLNPGDFYFTPNGSLIDKLLWPQTRGLYIKNDPSVPPPPIGDYYPNLSGGGGSERIYQITNGTVFNNSLSDSFQFRVYLTNNSDEILTMTQDDIDFSGGDVSYNGEMRPYWRYRYIPDVSNDFISFGQPGHAAPPRNISNGGGLNSSVQPVGPPTFNGVPAQTYRTLNITGAGHNADPFTPPSGAPASSSANTACVADVCLNILYDQLTSYSMSCVYSFDLSGEYRYPLDPSAGVTTSEEWGEQYDPSGGDPLPKQTFETTALTSNVWSSNNLNVANNNKPNNINNNYILPGYTYYISNYNMRLNGIDASQNIQSEMYTPGGGGDSVGNSAVAHLPIVIKPPTRSVVGNQYNSYLTSATLYSPSPGSTHTGTAYTPLTSGFYAANSSNQFGPTVFFFDLTSNYTFNLNSSPRRCILNKVSNTTGYPSDDLIGQRLSIPLPSAPSTTKFKMDVSVSGTSYAGHALDTSYAEAWGSSSNINASNTFHEIQTSTPKDAYTSATSGIEYDRLHGWYMGIDVTDVISSNINLLSYPDISNNGYQPYNFKLEQFIDTNDSSVNPSNETSVGSSSEYNLYIGKTPEQDISWNPNPFPALTTTELPLSPQFFGINLPTGGQSNPQSNTNIVVAPGIDLSGDLVQIDTTWRPSNTILTAAIKYFTAQNTANSLGSHADVEVAWAYNPQLETQNVNEYANIKISDLMQSSMNYARSAGHNPQFKFQGTHRNNLLRTPSNITLTDTGGSPNIGVNIGGDLLWWDYTWGTSLPIAWNGTSGSDFKSGFINFTGTAATNIQNLCVRSTPNIDELPFIAITDDPDTNFPRYNHTEDISYNQSMWALEEFRGNANTTNNSKNPYINYQTSNFFGQTADYSFTGNTGDDLSYNFISFADWAGNISPNSFQPPGGNVSNNGDPATWTNIKWLTFKMRIPLLPGSQPPTSLIYSLQDEGGSDLQPGTEYCIFTRFRAPGTPYVWVGNSTARQYTPWLDPLNGGTSASTSGSNSTLGAAQNGVYDPNNRQSDTELAMLIFGNNGQTSSTVYTQYIRIGILVDKHVAQINLEYKN